MKTEYIKPVRRIMAVKKWMLWALSTGLLHFNNSSIVFANPVLGTETRNQDSVLNTEGANLQVESPIEKRIVNGFTVYLISSTDDPSKAGYILSVPYGTSDDKPQYFGRAHFFEHMFSRGLQKHPGHSTLVSQMSKFGFARNAGTGWSSTTYFGYGPTNSLLQAMDLQLASLERPEFSADSLSKERQTVINEVVESMPNLPQRAMMILPFAHLPPAHHSERGYLLGQREGLMKIGESELRELHERVYQPGIAQIAVVANWAKGPLTKDAVIQQLEQTLPKNHSIKKWSPRGIKDRFVKERNWIHIESKNEMVLTLYFELPIHADRLALEAWVAAFQYPAHGSVIDVLKNKLGLINGIEMDIDRFSDRRVVSIDLDLTPDGFKRRHDLVPWVFFITEQFRNQKMDPSLLVDIQRVRRESLVKNSKSIDDLISLARLAMGQGKMENFLNLEYSTRHFTPEMVQKGAQLLPNAPTFVSIYGPFDGTVQSPEVDPLFGLRYSVSSLAKELGHQTSPIDGNIQIHDLKAIELNLPSLPNTEAIGDSLLQIPAEGWKEFSSKGKKYQDRAFAAQLHFEELSLEQSLALKIWWSALHEMIRPEIFKLYSSGTNLDYYHVKNGLVFKVSGSKNQESQSLVWLWNKMKDIEIPSSTLERVRDQFRLALQKSELQFAAKSAMQTMELLLDPDIEDATKSFMTIDTLNLNDVPAIAKKILASSNKTLFWTGPFSAEEKFFVRSELQKFSPNKLRMNQPVYRGKLRDRREHLETIEHFEPWKSNNQNGFGLIETYALPGVEDLEAIAAMRVAAKVIHPKVFLRARPFGYVQGVSFSPLTIQNSRILFYGQAETKQQLEQMKNIWREEIAALASGKVAAEEISSVINGFITSLEANHASASDGLDAALSQYTVYGDPRFIKLHLLPTLKSMTPEVVMTMAQKWLNERSADLRVLKGGTGVSIECDKLLNLRRATGQKLLSEEAPHYLKRK